MAPREGVARQRGITRKVKDRTCEECGAECPLVKEYLRPEGLEASPFFDPLWGDPFSLELKTRHLCSPCSLRELGEQVLLHPPREGRAPPPAKALPEGVPEGVARQVEAQRKREGKRSAPPAPPRGPARTASSRPSLNAEGNVPFAVRLIREARARGETSGQQRELVVRELAKLYIDMGRDEGWARRRALVYHGRALTALEEEEA